ncbi:MAG: DUF938 domain-containing protein [Gammaproteobacteria bacterium]
MSKPFNPAAESNKHAIAAALPAALGAAREVLEIGAGTGQHAVHFAALLPALRWQTSELEAALPGLAAWVEEAALDNLPPPIALDVSARPWPVGQVDAVYSANTVHYMPLEAVDAMLTGIAGLLPPGGRFVLYGPFNYDGRYVSEGNRRLDAWLRSVDSRFAIRDIAELDRPALAHGLERIDDFPMPANNRLLVWQRLAA